MPPPIHLLYLSRKTPKNFLKIEFLLFLLPIFDLLAQAIFVADFWRDCSLKKEVMNNHPFGEIFESDAPRRARSSRSSSRARPSYNQDLITPRFGDKGDEGMRTLPPFLAQPFCGLLGF